MNAAESWGRARNILCVRLDQMGDVLMTTPAFRALKEPCPGRRLTLLTSEAGAEVAPLIPEIDDCIVYQAPWMKSTPAGAAGESVYRAAESLRRRKFDGAILFTVFSQNPLPAALLCFLAGIPLRLAYCHENPYQLLTHWVPDPEPAQGIRHEVRRHLDLVQAVGCRSRNQNLSLRVPASDRGRVAGLLRGIGVRNDRLAVIHPGASASSRRYPGEGFAAAAGGLVSELGRQVVFTGTGPEVGLVEDIRLKMGLPSHSLAGCLRLGELASLLSFASVVVTNNTGPAHLAAAVGAPIVSLYALTNPQHTPWGVPNRVLFQDVPCKNCFKSVCPEGHNHCLSLVEPAAIVRAAGELLGARRGARPFTARASSKGEDHVYLGH